MAAAGLALSGAVQIWAFRNAKGPDDWEALVSHRHVRHRPRGCGRWRYLDARATRQSSKVLEDSVRHLAGAHCAAEVGGAGAAIEGLADGGEDAVGDVGAAEAPAHGHFE